MTAHALAVNETTRAHEGTRDDLLRATAEERRLAALRQVLGVALIVFGAPVVVLNRSTDPAIKQMLAILALVWLTLFLPMLRLLSLTWTNSREIDRLRDVLEETDDQARRATSLG